MKVAYYTHTRSTGVCQHCGKSFLLTKAGVIRAHGPNNNRCPGVGKRCVQDQREAERDGLGAR